MMTISNAPLAQLVEHLTLNQGVQGSSPWRRTQSTGFGDIGALGSVFFFCSLDTLILKAIPIVQQTILQSAKTTSRELQLLQRRA